MLEDYCEADTLVPLRPTFKTKNPIAYYFAKVKELELDPGYTHFLSPETKKEYAQHLEEGYDVLFDRIMTSDTSLFLKYEVQEWYSFNRDFLGFCDTVDMNRELEQLLRRFELL